MKFTIRKSDILGVLSKIQGLTGRKTSLAITTNVLIHATDSTVVLKATDLETGFEGAYPAEVQEQGSVALNSRKLFEIVRDFPSEAVHVNEVENHWIEIGNDTVEYHLVGTNTDDFPEIPRFEDLARVSIDAAALNAMIEKTVYIGGSAEDKRAHIVGMLLEIVESQGENRLRLVSTDGSRLAKVDRPFEGERFAADGILVPKKGMYEVAKFLDSQGAVRIAIADNNLIVEKEKETIIIRLLEGNFPDYTEIIGKNDDSNVIKFNRQLFLMMLRRMSILSSEDYRSVLFHFEAGKLIITSTNPDIGESKEEVQVEFTGDPIEVAFNPRFFIEVLNVIDTDSVNLAIVDADKPCMLTGEDDADFITVIMPMRV